VSASPFCARTCSGAPACRKHRAMSSPHHPAGASGGVECLPYSGYVADISLNAVCQRHEPRQV
jgi:hypothetical protein